MTNNSFNKSTNKVDNLIAHLRDSKNLHFKLIESALASDEGNIFADDQIVFSAIHRSLCVIDGFAVMIEKRNYLCANALLRLQLDSVMRLYAFSIVDDSNKLFIYLFEGESLNKFKLKNGQKLSDNYLHKEVSKKFPWFSKVYIATSGFIHLSTPHLCAPISSINNNKRELVYSIGSGCEWQENEIIETIQAFIATTNILFHLCSSWIAAKTQGALDRKI